MVQFRVWNVGTLQYISLEKGDSSNMHNIYVLIAGFLASTATAAFAETQNGLPSTKLENTQIENRENNKETNVILDYSMFRSNAEQAIRSGLVDPSSAQFEWPHGFTYGTWKPFLKKRVTGYLTCGRVNARNRMGGYVGSNAFVVVLDASGRVIFQDLGDGSAYDLVRASCQKSAAMFPAPQPALRNVSASPISNSIADQLSKLAELKASGVLSEDEFETAKRRILSPDE